MGENNYGVGLGETYVVFFKPPHAGQFLVDERVCPEYTLHEGDAKSRDSRLATPSAYYPSFPAGLEL